MQRFIWKTFRNRRQMRAKMKEAAEMEEAVRLLKI